MPMLEKDGTFRAKVISKDFGLSSKGNEQLAVGFEVTEGECAGQHITDFLSFSDAALPYTEKKMRTMGFQGVDLLDISTLGTVEVDIVVATETYEGKERRKVKFINAAGASGVPITPMDDAAKRAFAAKMKSKLAGLNTAQAKAPAAKKSQPAKPQTQREEPPPPTDDDSLPF